MRVALNRSIQDRIIYDLAAVKERYGGLTPSQQPHIKALQGDTSDNIKGVPGIGAKTAIKLIQEYGSIDRLYENLDKVTPPRIRDLLATNEAGARQGLDLTTIVTDVPITLDNDACRFWRYDREEVVATLLGLEFRSILAQVPIADEPTESTSSLSAMAPSCGRIAPASIAMVTPDASISKRSPTKSL